MTGEKPEFYTEVKLRVPREQADAVCNFIIDNITSGLVLEEEEGSRETGITFYVPGAGDRKYRTDLGNYLEQVLPQNAVIPEIEERIIKNIEWVEQYKLSVKPIRIGDDIVVRPTWDTTETPARYEIVLEPKMAFGTGSHETTRSCLKIIRQRFRSGMTFLDLGCGSGILSILASKMGAEYILAVDYDVTAVENCRENFALNSVSTPHEIVFGSIEKCEGRRPFDFVCANIIKSVILPVLDRLLDVTLPGGVLVLSGLLPPDEAEITARLEELGQRDFTIMPDNQWLSYIIQRR
jgi:ribosomal protein L11 methyltransferase